MNLVLFEDDVKYDLWLKIILAGSLILLLALGIMFYVDAHSKDILPETPKEDSRIGTLIMFAAAAFVVLLYLAVLPRKIYICQDRIRIKFGFFFFNIPFSGIESYLRTKGIPMGFYLSSMTSYKNQVEIVRKSGLRMRISPTQIDLFMTTLNRAVSDWENIQRSLGKS